MKKKCILAIFIAVFLIWLLTPAIVGFLYSDIAERGQFGDTFGTTNALFTGLAFAGLIYTISLQREELSLQRKELKLTRNELKRSAAAQEKSEMSLASQVQAQLLSAKLNALSSVISHYSILIHGEGAAQRRIDLESKQKAYIRQLETLLNTINQG